MHFDATIDDVRLAGGRTVKQAVHDLRKRLPSARGLALAVSVCEPLTTALGRGGGEPLTAALDVHAGPAKHCAP